MKKLKLLLFLFIVQAYPVHALTLAQIKTEIRTRIKDTDASRRRYSDTQLLNLINQTQRDVVNISWIIKKSTSIPVTTGTTYYTMPSDIMGISRVTFNNRNLPEMTLESLDSKFNYANWPATSGLPSSYFQDPSRSSQIGLQPWPATTASTGTLSVIYFSQGTDMSSDSDIPFNSESRYAPYNDLLIYDPCYKVFLIEGNGTKAGEYKAFYESRIQILLSTLGQKPNYLPGFTGQRK